MQHAYIYDHVRTPRGRGRADGALNEITPLQLGTQVLQGLRERSEFNTAQVDDVVFGIVSPVGEQGTVLPRLAALNAGFDQRVAGVQVNRFCGSGLEAFNLASAQVMSGQVDGIIAGGVESMSRVPLGSDGGAWATDPSFAPKVNFVPQGVSADLLATMNGFTREQVDAFALESQRRAALAQKGGHFEHSLLAVRDVIGNVVLERDEYLRPSTRAEDLAGLKPAFETLGRGGFDAVALRRYPQYESIRHVHTAGNSSGIVDGACAVLVGSELFGQRNGLKARGRVRAFASVGSEPCVMLSGPVAAAEKALGRAGMGVADIDLFEVNEAFASVVMYFMKTLEIPHSKVNVNGGAIALGHPLGATGSMLVGMALDELERTGRSTALITLCIGAGMATAAIIERV